MEKKLYSPIEVLQLFNRKFTKEMKLVFLSVIISGVIAHGAFIFNNYYSFDAAASLFEITGTYNHGRWFFYILVKVTELFFSNVYSALPVVCATITLLGIAISASMIVSLLNMKNSILIVLSGCFFSVFPVICAEFGYMGYPQYYFIALFMTVLAVFVTVKYKWGCIAGSILLMLGLGIYQAFFPNAVVLFLLLIMYDLIDNVELKEIWKRIGKYVATLGVGMAMYFVANKTFIRLKQAYLTSYQGIDSMGHVTINELLHGIQNAYKGFANFMFTDNMGLSGSALLRKSLLLVVILSIILLGVLLCSHIKSIGAKSLFGISVLIFPLAVNIIYVMCCNEGAFVYSLMLYSSVFFFVFPLMLFDKYEQLYSQQKFGIVLQWLVIALSIVMIFYYIGYDNIAYSKANMIQQQTDTYCNTLVTQIKSVEGYSDEYPIILVQDREKEGRFDFNDASMIEIVEYNNLSLNPYGGTMRNWIRDYSFEYYLKYRTGFGTKLDKDISSIKNMNMVKQMPCYPESGSIKIIDNQIIVKLSDY